MVQKDWTVVCQNQWYQLDRQHEPLGLAGKKIIVRTLRDGTVQLVRQGVKLRFRRLSVRPQRRVEKPLEVVSPLKAPGRLACEHPWRQPLLGGRRRAERAAAQLGMGDSGRPTLRSGLPPSPIPSTKIKH